VIASALVRFTAEYREQATLRDGRIVTLRLLRASDRPQLARGFNRLSDEGRYKRFLSAKTRLSAAELDYLTDVDQQTHVAIGAVLYDAEADGNEGEGQGIARFIVDSQDPSVADTAVTVADDAQGNGLGSLLFSRLAAAAIERGVRRFRGEVLASNRAMVAITEAMGDSPGARATKAGVAKVEFDLPGATPEPRESVAKHPFLRLFAEGEAVVREFLAWRWLRGKDDDPPPS